MFERRLKILLFVLALISIALVGRAFQIQGIQRNYWRDQASGSLTKFEYIDTTRANITDCQGRILAQDVPSIDACVDYRVITADPEAAWLSALARKNLHARLKEGSAALEQEKLRIKGQLLDMWGELSLVSGKTPDEIAEIRRSIQQKVQMRRTYVNWRSEHAVFREGDSDGWYLPLMSDDTGSANKGTIETEEQRQSYVIVAGLSTDQQVELARNMDKYPGLSLQPSKHRYYPFGETACHVLGTLGTVGKEDIDHDPFAGNDLLQYRAHDLIGRGGVEALCEKTLRGLRGRVEKMNGSDEILSSVEPVRGKDVRLTIDVELESDILAEFNKVRKHTDNETLKEETRSYQHGACVIFKVDTNEVLAMVSNPGFDPNTLSENLPKLITDDLNLPLLSRATEMAVEPGSTVKPMVGMGAITDGLMSENDTVPCHGILIIDQRELPFGHCWIYSHIIDGKHVTSHNVAMRRDPGDDRYRNDNLTFADGLEQSCNVFFGTIAYRMGIHSLCDWYYRFGLGRPTGVGIRESAGRLYRPSVDNNRGNYLACSAGIGEGVVQATPIQMANVAATIARNGIWMRPRLVSPQDIGRATTQPSPDLGPDRVDLHLAPEALHAAQQGMIRSATPPYGMAKGIMPKSQEPNLANDPLAGMVIAGKTGTAQTAQLSIPMRDADGNIMRDENNRVLYKKVPLSAATDNWYRSLDNHFQHAWYIGYAPADHPQVAFCVMVEYGETGGRVAGAIAHDALVACVRHGYLVPVRTDAVQETPDLN